jgi:xanthine dehydrogenase iron-sulfur cluster and FAD-binding subunit A
MWQTYYTPSSIDEALALLAEYGSEARIIAGGTDLILEIERMVRRPRYVIDVTRIPGLDAIQLGQDGLIHLGPLVTHNQVVGSGLCVERAFPLVKACWEVGAPQIRNRGTVAGNLITASPANDTITPLWAMEAKVTLKSSRGERELEFKDFFQGARKTHLESDEMLVDIAFRPLEADERGTFLKLGLRRAQAISVVNVAVILRFEDNARVGTPPVSVAEGRITLGSVAPTIVHARDAERALAGQTLTDETIELIAGSAALAAVPIDDIRGSANYRRYMVSAYTQRALEQLRDGTERHGFPLRPVMLWGRTEGRFPVWSSDLAKSDRREVLSHSADGGSCTVILDGIAVMSCLVPAPRAHGSQILTIEGLATPEALHPVQKAFVDEGAVQCGYCTPGFIMSGVSLLEEKPSPSRDEIKQAITGNLCRCTGYYSIINAIDKAGAREAMETR